MSNATDRSSFVLQPVTSKEVEKALQTPSLSPDFLPTYNADGENAEDRPKGRGRFEMCTMAYSSFECHNLVFMKSSGHISQRSKVPQKDI